MRHLVFMMFGLCCCICTNAARVYKAPKEQDTKFVANMLHEYINNLTAHIEHSPKFIESLQNMNATHGEPDFSTISNDIIQKLNQIKVDLKHKILALNRMDKDETYPVPHELLKVLDAGHPASFSGADIRALFDTIHRRQNAALDEQDKVLKELEIAEILKRWEKHESDTESQRQAYIKEYEKLAAKRNAEKHFKPGSVAQEKETWQESDEFDADSYSPDLFFLRHDVNSDGYLDIDEIEALYAKQSKSEGSDTLNYKYIVDSTKKTLEFMDKDGDNRISREEHNAYESSIAAQDTSAWDDEDDLDDLGAVANEKDMQILEKDLEKLSLSDSQSDMLRNLRQRAEKLQVRMKEQPHTT